MKPYEVTFFHRTHVNDNTLISKDVYRFKTRLDRVYFIEVEVYENNIYFAKFYLRIHQHLKTKYKQIINDGDGFRVLSTCISLAKQISDTNKLSSFGFIGESRISESMDNTQRYRVYKLLSAKYFDPKKYDHVKDEINSIYFILNKSNPDLNINDISERLNEYYIIPECDFEEEEE